MPTEPNMPRNRRLVMDLLSRIGDAELQITAEHVKYGMQMRGLVIQHCLVVLD
jgi:hypothetical protein